MVGLFIIVKDSKILYHNSDFSKYKVFWFYLCLFPINAKQLILFSPFYDTLHYKGKEMAGQNSKLSRKIFDIFKKKYYICIIIIIIIIVIIIIINNLLLSLLLIILLFLLSSSSILLIIVFLIGVGWNKRGSDPGKLFHYVCCAICYFRVVSFIKSVRI